MVELIELLEPMMKLSENIVDAGRRLNKQNFKSRYPDSLTEGYPAEFYDEKIAQECIHDAETILSFVEANLP